MEAMSFARGSFQRGILSGSQFVSLSDLRGTSRKYKTRYWISLKNLLSRLRSNGFKVEFIYGKSQHGRKRLVVNGVVI